MFASQNVKKVAASTEHNLSVIVFSLFFAWILSFPFEGQVLYSLADSYSMDASRMVFIAISAHFLGLFTGGFLVKDMPAAKKMMKRSSLVCLCGSLIFFADLPVLLLLVLGLIAYAAGSLWLHGDTI